MYTRSYKNIFAPFFERTFHLTYKGLENLHANNYNSSTFALILPATREFEEAAFPAEIRDWR